MSAGIDLENVCCDFGTFRAVDNANVSIRPGEFFSFLGPSGCGKTTILRMVSGFIEPTEGSIRIGGKDVKGTRPNQRPTALIFQNLALFPLMPIWENISFGLEVRGVDKATRRKKAEDLLKLVDLPGAADKMVSQLSGGQKQRVAIARALAVEPSVMLLDEPLSALDLKLRKEMQIELKQLQAEAGITFLFVTHDQEEALALSDRVAVMQGGRILQMGPPREIYDAPTHRFVADFIGDINLLEGEALTGGGVRVLGGVTAPGSRPGRVTLAIRPERARLVAAGTGELEATLIHSAFLGTATLHKLQLAGGGDFLIRQSDPTEAAPEKGSRVGVALPADALQVLQE